MPLPCIGLLLPAFILATLSFVGLGFPDTIATWGTMLRDADNVALLADAPWSLAPAFAIFLVVLGVDLVVQSGGRAPLSAGTPWVKEDCQRRAFGTALLERAEALARERHCHVAFLSTMMFQAPAFYEKCGYTAFGELPHTPGPRGRIWFAKRL